MLSPLNYAAPMHCWFSMRRHGSGYDRRHLLARGLKHGYYPWDGFWWLVTCLRPYHFCSQWWNYWGTSLNWDLSFCSCLHLCNQVTRWMRRKGVIWCIVARCGSVYNKHVCAAKKWYGWYCNIFRSAKSAVLCWRVLRESSIWCDLRPYCCSLRVVCLWYMIE